MCVVQTSLVQSVIQRGDVFYFDSDLSHLRRVRGRVELDLEFFLNVCRDVHRSQLGGRLNLFRLNHRNSVVLLVRPELCDEIFHHIDIHPWFVDGLQNLKFLWGVVGNVLHALTNGFLLIGFLLVDVPSLLFQVRQHRTAIELSDDFHDIRVRQMGERFQRIFQLFSFDLSLFKRNLSKV